MMDYAAAIRTLSSEPMQKISSTVIKQTPEDIIKLIVPSSPQKIVESSQNGTAEESIHYHYPVKDVRVQFGINILTSESGETKHKYYPVCEPKSFPIDSLLSLIVNNSKDESWEISGELKFIDVSNDRVIKELSTETLPQLFNWQNGLKCLLQGKPDYTISLKDSEIKLSLQNDSLKVDYSSVSNGSKEYYMDFGKLSFQLIDQIKEYSSIAKSVVSAFEHQSRGASSALIYKKLYISNSQDSQLVQAILNNKILPDLEEQYSTYLGKNELLIQHNSEENIQIQQLFSDFIASNSVDNAKNNTFLARAIKDLKEYIESKKLQDAENSKVIQNTETIQKQEHVKPKSESDKKIIAENNVKPEKLKGKKVKQGDLKQDNSHKNKEVMESFSDQHERIHKATKNIFDNLQILSEEYLPDIPKKAPQMRTKPSSVSTQRANPTKGNSKKSHVQKVKQNEKIQVNHTGKSEKYLLMTGVALLFAILVIVYIIF